MMGIDDTLENVGKWGPVYEGAVFRTAGPASGLVGPRALSPGGRRHKIAGPRGPNALCRIQKH